MLPDGGELLRAEALGLAAAINRYHVQLIPRWQVEEVLHDERLSPGGRRALAELLHGYRLGQVQWERLPVVQCTLSYPLDF